MDKPRVIYRRFRVLIKQLLLLEPYISVDIRPKLEFHGNDYGGSLNQRVQRNAHRITMLCIEFHHRWKRYGASATIEAVKALRALGFKCAWLGNEQRRVSVHKQSERLISQRRFSHRALDKNTRNALAPSKRIDLNVA